MDQGLVRWARAVKQRRRSRLPILWLFTDAARLADPLAAAAALPKNLCGIVLRDDALPGRAALAARLAAICKARRIALVIAGDARLAARLHAGLHLRGGAGRATQRLCTASAHDAVQLRRARRAGAAIVFLSPALPTASHPGGGALQPCRWARLARGGGVYALGGINGGTIKRFPGAGGAGAIAAYVEASSSFLKKRTKKLPVPQGR